MGATTELIAFDHHHHVEIVVPALRAFLAGETIPDWLDEILPSADSHPYQHLDVELDLVCGQLDAALGVRGTLNELVAINPSIAGGCVSLCSAQSKCPFHKSGSIPAEAAMEVFQNAFLTNIVAQPESVFLGRHAQYRDLAWWYGWELGNDEKEEQLFLTSNDNLPLLITLLTKRGAVWGWSDGGFGEGLLGWLDEKEGSALVEALDAYDLSASAESLDTFFDPYTKTDALPEMRQVMDKIIQFTLEASSLNLGVVMVRW